MRSCSSTVQSPTSSARSRRTSCRARQSARSHLRPANRDRVPADRRKTIRVIRATPPTAAGARYLWPAANRRTAAETSSDISRMDGQEVGGTAPSRFPRRTRLLAPLLGEGFCSWRSEDQPDRSIDTVRRSSETRVPHRDQSLHRSIASARQRKRLPGTPRSSAWRSRPRAGASRPRRLCGCEGDAQSSRRDIRNAT